MDYVKLMILTGNSKPGTGNLELVRQPCLDTIPLARSLLDNRISICSAKAELLDNRLPLTASGSRVILPDLYGLGWV